MLIVHTNQNVVNKNVSYIKLALLHYKQRNPKITRLKLYSSSLVLVLAIRVSAILNINASNIDSRDDILFRSSPVLDPSVNV